MALTPKNHSLTVLPPTRPATPAAARPSPFSLEVLTPAVPGTLRSSGVFRDLTESAMRTMGKSRREAKRFAESSALVAQGWSNVASAVVSMASAQNAAAHCAKIGAELAAETSKVLADATLHRANVYDQIGALEDGAKVREATRDERITHTIEMLRMERRRQDLELRNAEAEGALARKRTAIELLDLERKSRTEKARAFSDMSNSTFQRAYESHRAPVGPGAETNEDDIAKLIGTMGTYATRQELQTFFRAALLGDLQCHPLAPCVSFIYRRETELRGTSAAEAIRTAARTAMTYLERPRETWSRDVAAQFLELLRELNATLKVQHDDELRRTIDRENEMYSGTVDPEEPAF